MLSLKDGPKGPSFKDATFHERMAMHPFMECVTFNVILKESGLKPTFFKYVTSKD